MTQAHQTAGRTLRRAAARLALPESGVLVCSALALAGGFLLAGFRLFSRSTPLALALVAALPFGVPALCAYLGAVAGYLAFWGLSAAFEPITAGFLILAETCIFSGFLPREQKWFMPLSAALLYGLTGFLQLVQSDFAAAQTGVLLLRMTLLAIGCAQCEAALRGEHTAKLFLALCLISGSAAIAPFGLPLGAIPAAGMAFLAPDTREGALYAAAGGLALELSGASGGGMTAAFSLSALLCRQLPPQPRALRAGAFVAGTALGVLLTGGAGAPMLLGTLVGTALAAALAPQTRALLKTGENTVSAERLAQTALAADVFERLGRVLGRSRVRNVETQSAAVFDRASEEVCRSCAKWSVCWEARAGDTYQALSRSGGRIVRRGQAVREDLPEAFLAQCTNLRRFLQAVNDALDEQLSRRQYQSRMAESRLVLAGQLCAAARLLQRAAEPESAAAVRAAFVPELGCARCAAAGRNESGDKSESFVCGEWYYALMCDGMGSGEEAAREAQSAVSLLRDLICAGLEAQDALEMLNGVYILRGDGVFSTVDLAQVSLVSGEGFLLKWGAAPSYLRRGTRIARLGSQTLPPGLSAGSGGAECLRVSMQSGETLILLSDGAEDAQTERRLRSFAGTDVQALADELVGSGKDAGEDDRTALVLRLRRSEKRRKCRA